ncbi:MAG: DUF4831 family protein [Candidatus Azobacteroides sp.]|nr:DUF4831 family protein [Candidatus Azobacteroides sp.]
MKRIGIFFFILFTVNFLNAQTKVIKMSATKSTDFGVTYFLPKTVLTVQAEYSKTTQKAGPYARYAEKYLGVKEQSVVFEDRVFYTLNAIRVESKGIADKDASYLVEFKSKTTSPFVYLTEDGLICTINADYIPESVNNNKTATAANGKELTSLSQSVFTEEYLTAGSITKKAEVAAKQIYKLRESRTDLLTGNADNAPRDGEGMKIVLANLEAQEKTLMELFTGTTSVESLDSEFEIEPLTNIDKEILFRFSKYIGAVDKDDLSGSPVYINIKNQENTDTQEIVDPKRKAKETQSIVYNVPGKAEVEVFYGVNSMYKNTLPVVQFGSTQILASSLFDDKKVPVKIYFYPETGAIKQIIQ